MSHLFPRSCIFAFSRLFMLFVASALFIVGATSHAGAQNSAGSVPPKQEPAAAVVVLTAGDATPTPLPLNGTNGGGSPTAATTEGAASTENESGRQATSVPAAVATEAAPAAGVTPTAAKSGSTVPPEKAQPVRLPVVAKSPVIDGKLDDEMWRQAAVFKDFYQVDPGDNTKPSQPTEMYMAMDAKFLYFAVHAFDDPKGVRARVAKRDQIFEDDYVGFFLDTYNDRRKGYAIWFNPLGIQADGIKTDGQGEDYSIDLVMESKGQLTADGFVVEVAIPFKSLRYEAGKGKLWGVHFLRRIKRLNNELSSWMPISRDINGTFNQAGHLTGLEGIATERNLEVIPSFTISETGRRVSSLPPVPQFDVGRIVNEPIKTDLGVTVKYGITPTITLDFAYNPDFAQVEADATVVTANQRFPIFFEEKRPFFLEGIDIFRTQNNVVHTRAIVDPDLALKLTGKRGRNTFGLLIASDNAPGNFGEDARTEAFQEEARRLPGEPQGDIRLLDKNAYIGVLRLKRDVGRESNVGMFATTYNFIEKHNHVLGFDGRFKLDPQTVASFEVVGTSSRNFFYEPALDQNRYRTGNAFAYSLRYQVNKRHYGWNYDGRGRTRDYRTDVGFVQRTNTNRHGVFGFYQSEPRPKAKLISYFVGANVRTHFNWQGQQHEWGYEPQFNLQLAHQTAMGGGYSRDYERIFEKEFGPERAPNRAGAFFGADNERSTRINTFYYWLESTLTKKVGVEAFLGTRRGAFDFDFGGGRRYPRVSPAALALGENAPLDPGSANALDLNFEVTYKPTNPLNLSLEYTRAKLTRRDTGLPAFDDHIFSLRGTYQFTRFTFARLRVDYDTLASNVRGQYLLGWTPNPGTALFVGYNDSQNYNGFNRFNNNLEPGFRLSNRVFFIKASYLFRKSF